MEKKLESTTTADVATARPTRLGAYSAKPTRFGIFLRNQTVSAAKVNDYTDLLNFLIELDEKILEIDELESFERILGDIEYMGRTSIDETTVYNDVAGSDDPLDKIYRNNFYFQYGWMPASLVKLLPPEDQKRYASMTTPEPVSGSNVTEGILRAKISGSSKCAYARQWYKANRAELAKKRKKLARSAEGIKRKRRQS